METLDQLIDVSPSPGYDLDKRTLLGNLLLNPMCTEMERIHLLNSIGEHFSLDLYTQSDTSPLKISVCGELPPLLTECQKFSNAAKSI